MTRRVLPNRRGGETIEFDHASDRGMPAFRYRASFTRFEDDGAVAELFVNQSGRVGTTTDVNARDAAIASSLALQYGCPEGVLRAALTRNQDGSAAGAVCDALDRIAVLPPPTPRTDPKLPASVEEISAMVRDMIAGKESP